jgi:hypothetical protein
VPPQTDFLFYGLVIKNERIGGEFDDFKRSSEVALASAFSLAWLDDIV